MALKALNSVAGFSVGEVANVVIYANSDVSPANLVVSGKSNLNSISNVIITGGAPGYLLSTDGSGSLSFIAPPSTTGITNGTSNVSIPTLNGNITLNVGGTANVLLVTQTGTDAQGNINPALANTYQLGNATNRWNNVYANTANVIGNIAAGGVLTDNLYYANGSPWDLQQAAGANYEIQYNIDDNFAASANFTYNDSTQLFTVLGNSQFNNANLGNLAIANYVNVASNVTTNNLTVNLELAGNTANFTGNIKALNSNLGNLATANYVNVASNTITSNLTVNLELAGNTANFSGNIKALNSNLGNLATANYVNVASNTITSNLTVNLEFQANTANFDGNVVMDNWLTVANTANVGNLRTDNLLYANGQPWDLQLPAGSNTYIQYNNNGSFGANANFTFDEATSNLTVNGNIIIGSSGKNQIVNAGANVLEIRGGLNDANGIVALAAGDYGNGVNWGKISVYGNLGGNATNQYESNIHAFQKGGGGSNVVIFNTLSTAASSTTTGAVQVAGGIGATGNVYVGGILSVAGNANVNNLGTAQVLATANVTAPQLISNIASGTAPLVVTSTTRVANLNVDAAGTADAATNASAVLANLASSGVVYPTFITSTTDANYSLQSNATFTANLANGGFTATTFVGNLQGTTVNVSGQITSTQATGTAPFAVSSTTRVANLNVSYANVSDFEVVTTQNTGVFYPVFVNGNTTANYALGSNTALSYDAAAGNLTSNNLIATNKVTAGNGLSVTTGTLTVSNGNLDVTGNINVTGNLNYSNVTDLVVGDPLIYIGANNTGDLYDLGIVASYNDGTYQHTGIVRNHTTDYWTFFDGVVNEPTTVIDWANATYPTVYAGNFLAVGNVTSSRMFANANITTPQFISNVATGTAPLSVQSTTRVSNLNVSYANVSDYGVVTSQNTGTYYPTFVNGSTTANYALASNSAISANLANGGLSATTFVGNLSGTNGNLTTANVSGSVILGNSTVTTTITWDSATTSSISANQTIASISTTGVTGLEFLVKGIDSAGAGKYSVATVQAVTDGTNVDYSVFGTVNLGGSTGTLAVNISGGFVRLQVTPASSNSTVWTTQVRII